MDNCTKTSRELRAQQPESRSQLRLDDLPLHQPSISIDKGRRSSREKSGRDHTADGEADEPEMPRKGLPRGSAEGSHCQSEPGVQHREALKGQTSSHGQDEGVTGVGGQNEGGEG